MVKSMTSKKCTIFLVFLAICLWSNVQSLTIKDNEIHDLEKNYEEEFGPEVLNWQVSALSPVGKVYTNCSGQALLGGFEVMWSSSVTFKRSYSSIIAHSSVFLTVDFWLLGSWDASDSISIKMYQGATLTFSKTVFPIIPPLTWTALTCGSANINNLMPVTLISQAPHSGSDLSIEIGCQSQYIPGQSLGYCGIRNVRISFSSIVRNEAINAITQTGASTLLPSIAWGCPTGQFKNTTGKCESCAITCENCFNKTSCLSCKKDRMYDGTTCVGCHSSCSTCSGPLESQCLSCSNSAYFLHPNGTCQSSCPSPYKSTTKNNIKYCQFPCNDDSYLYPDQTCQEVCPKPLLITEYDGGKYCLSPCRNQDYFYYSDSKTCQLTCSDPYASIALEYYKSCYRPKQTEVIDYIKAVSGGIISVGLMLNSIVTISDPSAILITTLATMSHYVKYLNISYSRELAERLEFQYSSSISLDFWFDRSDFTEEELELNAAPYVFKIQRLQPSFLENSWPTLMILFIVLAIFGLLKLFEWISKKAKKEYIPSFIMAKIKVILYNFFLTLFYIAYPNLLLFAIIDYKSPRNRPDRDGLGICLSVFIIVVGLVIFWCHLSAIRKQDRLMDEEIIFTDQEVLDFYKKNENKQVLIIAFKDLPFLSHIFLLIFIARAILCVLILALFFQSPYIQAILIIILNFFMLLYLFIQMPLKDRVQGIYQILYEILLLGVNGSILTMAVFDQKGNDPVETKDGLGKFILSLNLIFNLVALVYLIGRVVDAVRYIRKSRKTSRRTEARLRVSQALRDNEASRNMSLDPNNVESIYNARHNSSKSNGSSSPKGFEDQNVNMFSPDGRAEASHSFAGSNTSFINDMSYQETRGHGKHMMLTEIDPIPQIIRVEGQEPASFGEINEGYAKDRIKSDPPVNVTLTKTSIIQNNATNLHGAKHWRRENQQNKMNIRPIRVGYDELTVKKLSTLDTRPNSSSSAVDKQKAHQSETELGSPTKDNMMNYEYPNKFE